AFDNSFKSTMLKCNQQVALWECGYYVMKFVFETLYIKQKTFSDQLLDSTRALRQDELDGWDVSYKFMWIFCLLMACVFLPVLTNARLVVEIFDGTGHFGMWQSKVLDALFQQGLDIAIEESKLEDI
nr:retrovirus-related Pol polyprotein from transposon TNT 1-94 [Tanacetum cinerariifolium]